MNGEDRMHRLEVVLEKLQTSEVSCKRIAHRCLIVSQELKAKLDENDSHKSKSKARCSKTTISSSTSSKKSKKEKQLELLQKRIFQFHEDVSLINDTNKKSNSRSKLFLNTLERTNLDVWKSSTVKYPVTKLEYQMDFQP